jgi:putative hydrolase of HD superfamily
MGQPELQRILDLQAFLQKFNSIDRAILHPGSTTRRETDTEHSFSLAMVAWFLASGFPELNIDKLIKFALVHDLVEIYAGDTFAYGDKSLIDSKVQREHDALKQIEAEWPDFKEMVKTIRRYEKLDSPESKFVYALDKLMPIFMVLLGKGLTWQEKQITLDKVIESKTQKVALSPEINSYYKKLLVLLKENEHYFGKESS